jgi:hypothetical protein
MLRNLGVTTLLLFAGAGSALAQAHESPYGKAHPPGHVRPAGAHHAAVHALIHGTWTGAMQSPRGASHGLDLAVAHDSLRGIMLTLSSGSIPAAEPRDLKVSGDTLSWTQDLAGTSCAAAAVVRNATQETPAIMKGTMTRADGKSTFTLLKKA